MSKLQLYPQQLIAVLKITYNETNEIVITPIELGKPNDAYDLELPFRMRRLLDNKFYYVGTKYRQDYRSIPRGIIESIDDIRTSVILHSNTQTVTIEDDLIFLKMDVSTSLGIPADAIDFTTLCDIDENNKIQWWCYIDFLDKTLFPRRLVGYNHE